MLTACSRMVFTLISEILSFSINTDKNAVMLQFFFLLLHTTIVKTSHFLLLHKYAAHCDGLSQPQ